MPRGLSFPSLVGCGFFPMGKIHHFTIRPFNQNLNWAAESHKPDRDLDIFFRVELLLGKNNFGAHRNSFSFFRFSGFSAHDTVFSQKAGRISLRQQDFRPFFISRRMAHKLQSPFLVGSIVSGWIYTP